MNPDLATLMHSAFFSHLSRKAASTLAGSALLKTYLEGDVIFRQQDQADFFCIVLRGYARLIRTCDSVRIASLRICEPGDVFGECMLRVGPTYPYGAEAAENCVLAQFDLAAVRKLAEEDRSVDDAVMHVLSQNLLTTLNCVAEDRLHTAPQRLAAYLLRTAQAERRQGVFRLPFRKSLLAAKLGLTPEGLSRAFALLKDHGIAVQGRTIRIEDSELLSSPGHFPFLTFAP